MRKGDRVRIAGTNIPGFKKGETGVISNDHPHDSWDILVRLDSGVFEWGFREEEVEVIDA